MLKLEVMDELRGKAENLKRTGPRTAKSICERILTVPERVVKAVMGTEADQLFGGGTRPRPAFLRFQRR